MNAEYKEQAARVPDLIQLNEEFDWAVNKRESNIFARHRENIEKRNCIWAGQSWDGRKWKPRGNEEEIFPWPGASDARVPLIDLYINQDVALDLVTLARMRIRAYGTEINDEAYANRLTQVLRWMLYTQIGELWTEAELLSNYIKERGSGVMMVHWCYERQLGYEEIDLESIKLAAVNMAQAGGPEIFAALPEMIMDETMEEQVAELAMQFYPDVAKERLRKVVRDLRADGYARFPRPFVTKNRPRLTALCPNDDFFMPPEASDIETARACFWVEPVSETTLRERVTSYKWDAKWVAQVIESQRGVFTTDLSNSVTLTRRTINSRSLLNTEKLFEVVHCYRRLADEEGVPGIYYTVINPGMLSRARSRGQSSLENNGYAYHDLLDYQHGKKPLVLFEREKRCRLIDESRGYGEVGGTWQNQIKVQWDSRTDRTSLATVPPLLHPIGRPPTKWGPGVKQGVTQRDQYSYAEIPRYDIGSKEIEETVRKFANQYHGRPTDEFDAVMSGVMQQARQNRWMNGWKEVGTQVLQLMQQFMPDKFYYRVVGSDKGQSIHATRDEIQGQFDISVSFNTQDLDPEHVEKRLALMEKVLAFDVSGTVDRNEVLAVAFELIDPNLGERLLQPAEAAAQKEIEDEQTVMAKLASGIDVDIKPGQAYGLRYKVLNNTVGMSQPLQKLLQSNPDVLKLFEKRAKQLQFQIEQTQVNPQIGRLLGTQPAGKPEA